jgi:hypothetical protein
VALVLEWGVLEDICFENLETTPTRASGVDFKTQNWVRGIAGLEYDCSVEGLFGDGGYGECGWVCGGWWVLKVVDVGGKEKRLEWCGGEGGKTRKKRCEEMRWPCLL